MDLSNESNPYYALRDQDLVEWHLWTRSTVELARSQRKDLRVVIGSYYSQDAHFLEKSRYRDQALAFSLNQTYVNVIVDRDELPAFEHFYRSIVLWKLDVIEENNLFYSYANLPLVLVLDSETLLPKRLHNEMKHLDVEVDFDVDPKLRLIADKPDVAIETEEEIEQWRKQMLDSEITFGEYLDNLFDSELKVTFKSLEQLRTNLEVLRHDTHPKGGNLMANVMKHGKVANYLMDDARWELAGDQSRVDLATVLLTRLARSAHFDHLGGGFFQSKAEKSQLIPVAEKRLTVSAYLLETYCRALSMVDDSLFKSVVRLTADFLSDQLTSQDTFTTTVSDLSRPDASHYAWNKKSLARLLTKAEFRLIETLYGLDRDPNYQGSYLLERQDSWQSVVDRLDLEPDQAQVLHESARQKMLEARNDSELVADDLFNPLTCAAVSKALVFAASTLGEPDYFGTARLVMGAMIETFDVLRKDKEFDTSGSKVIKLKTVEALFMLDTFLVMLEHEWDASWYEMAWSLWILLVKTSKEDDRITYRKLPFCGEQKPADFISVPDFAPIFDYQSDRRSETAIVMDVARKIASIESIDYPKDLYYRRIEGLEKSVDRHETEHIEYLGQIVLAGIYVASIVLRGPVDKCRYWKANIRIPPGMDIQIYVIPYGIATDLFWLPDYVRPKKATKGLLSRVSAFVSDQSEKVHRFTNLMKLNAYLQKVDDF